MIARCPKCGRNKDVPDFLASAATFCDGCKTKFMPADAAANTTFEPDQRFEPEKKIDLRPAAARVPIETALLPVENYVSIILKWAAIAWTVICGSWCTWSTISIVAAAAHDPYMSDARRNAAVLAAWALIGTLWIVPTIGFAILSMAFRKK